MDEMLHAASGVAAYRWGSLVLEASRLAPADAAVLKNALSGAITGTLPAETAIEQRAAIALLHELVHLQQDLSTGLGAWDHLMTREPLLRLISQSRWLVLPGAQPPYRDRAFQRLAELGASDFTEQVRGDLMAVEAATVAAPQLRGASWASGDVQLFLAARLGFSPSQGEIEELSLRRLMESEAACVVFRSIKTSRHSEIAQEWLDEHQDFWLPTAMGDAYLSGIQMLLSALVGDDVLTRDNVMSIFDVVARALPWVVDLACAYPDPNLRAASHLAAAAFDPVLRFSEMTRCLAAADDVEAMAVVENAVLGERDEAELRLAAIMEVQYPTSQRTYEGWLDILEPVASSDKWDAGLFQLRVDAIQARLEGRAVRGIEAMIEAQTPVQIMLQGQGMHGLTHGKHFDSWESMRRALLDRRLDLELYELFYGSGTFSCPYGRATRCPGEQPLCAEGISALPQLPPAESCHVRRSMEAIGWAIPGGNQIV